MLKLHHIEKSFGPVKVLKGISFDLKKGETLGLVGENGAGKSTLMNILGGVLEQSAGQIEFNGQPYHPVKVMDSLQQGIAFIHQELNLFSNLSIKENIYINEFPRRRGFIDHKDLHQKAKKLLEEVGLTQSPSTPVAKLTNGQQQLVEIAKALRGQPKLIIFDEPTTALSQQETNRLLTLISALKRREISMIFISHNLDQVKAISDTIAVLRDGQLIAVQDARQYSKKQMIRDMVGRDLEQFFPHRETRPGNANKLVVEKLNVDRVNQISFKIREGEVLGLYGLVGAGRSEFVRGLYGLEKVYGGHAEWKGRSYSKFKPRNWIRNGVVYLTEDRREEGILSFKSIMENVQLAALPQFAFTGCLDYRQLKLMVKDKVNATRVRCQNLETQPVSELSGGNQQKVLLARWLMTGPELLILDEPTKGIDIGAREEIYHLVNHLVEQGSCVLLISSEIEELLGMCDRIMVMNQGAITAEFGKEEFDQSVILKHALKQVTT